jgi:hypothetical protein
MSMKVRQHKDVLRIDLPIEKPVPSKSGKTIVLASTHGLKKTGVRYKHLDIILVASAFVFSQPKPRRKSADSEADEAF